MWTLITCLGYILCLVCCNGQLTNIVLNPSVVSLPERQSSNVNLTVINVVPVGTIVNCDIINVDSPPLTAITDHPFQRSFQTLGPNNVEWYVYYDAQSVNKLDYDTHSTYQVTVDCVGVTNSASNILTVNVIENQAPVVSDVPSVSITKDAGSVLKGDLLYTVTASDPDGEPLTIDYQLTPNVDYFDINTVTNEIRADVDFLAVAETPINITLTVSDGDKSEQLVIMVDVTNLNSRPEITNLPDSMTLPENSPGGFELLLILFIDVDKPQSFYPSCTVTPATATPVFTVIGSRIYLTSKPDGSSYLDYETIQMFQISCRIFDDYLFSDGTDILTVTVTDVNEPPIFNLPVYPCQLIESKAFGSTCNIGVKTTDPEGDAVTLSLINTPESQRFQLTNPTGDYLTFAADYDIDNNAMPSSVEIDIEARDAAGQISTSRIAVTVLDKNDNSPVVLPNQGFDLTPSTVVGTIGTIVATDADSGMNSEVEFTVLNVNPITASQFITILPTGQVHYQKKFPDSMKDSTALITVQVKDKGTPPLSTTGIITVRFLGDTTVFIPSTVSTGGAYAGSNVTPAPSTDVEKSFFDQPANIALVVVVGVVLLVLLLVAFYFCIKKMLLGYCCGPKKPSNVYPSSDDYRYQQSNYYNRRLDNEHYGYVREPRGYHSSYPIRDPGDHYPRDHYPRDAPSYHKDYTSYSDFIREKPVFQTRPTSTIRDFDEDDDISVKGKPRRK